jgi:hypothetical protein
MITHFIVLIYGDTKPEMRVLQIFSLNIIMRRTTPRFALGTVRDVNSVFSSLVYGLRTAKTVALTPRPWLLAIENTGAPPDTKSWFQLLLKLFFFAFSHGFLCRSICNSAHEITTWKWWFIEVRGMGWSSNPKLTVNPMFGVYDWWVAGKLRFNFNNVNWNVLRTRTIDMDRQHVFP